MDFMYNENMCFQDEEIPFMPENPMLANAYVPFQKINCLYNPVKGLSVGTIFPELNMPYTKKHDDCKCRGYENG
jgi:hypothetical protein